MDVTALALTLVSLVPLVSLVLLVPLVPLVPLLPLLSLVPLVHLCSWPNPAKQDGKKPAKPQFVPFSVSLSEV